MTNTTGQEESQIFNRFAPGVYDLLYLDDDASRREFQRDAVWLYSEAKPIDPFFSFLNEHHAYYGLLSARGTKLSTELVALAENTSCVNATRFFSSESELWEDREEEFCAELELKKQNPEVREGEPVQQEAFVPGVGGPSDPTTTRIRVDRLLDLEEEIVKLQVHPKAKDRVLVCCDKSLKCFDLDLKLIKSTKLRSKAKPSFAWSYLDEAFALVTSRGGVACYDVNRMQQTYFDKTEYHHVRFCDQPNTFLGLTRDRLSFHDMRTKSVEDLAFEIEKGACFDVRENHIVLGQMNGVIQKLDCRQQARLEEYQYHKKKITSIRFSPLEADLMTSASADGLVTLWDVSKPTSLGRDLTSDDPEAPKNCIFVHQSHRAHDAEPVTSLDWLPNPQQNGVLVTTTQKSLHIWQIEESIMYPPVEGTDESEEENDLECEEPEAKRPKFVTWNEDAVAEMEGLRDDDYTFDSVEEKNLFMDIRENLTRRLREQEVEKFEEVQPSFDQEIEGGFEEVQPSFENSTCEEP